jgi:hypothetical protein
MPEDSPGSEGLGPSKQKEIVCPNQIDIVVTSEFGIKTLEELAGDKISELGRQICAETFYVGDTKGTRLKLKLHPNDVGGNLYETLKRVAEGIPKLKMYQQIMGQFDSYNEYLGRWDTDKYPLKRDVAMYLKRGFEYVKERWGVEREELLSSRKIKVISYTRKALFYALSRKFPSSGCRRKEGLSTVDIGAIFNRDHATVVVALKEFRRKIGEPKVKDSDLVELVLREAVGALGGIK